MSENLCKPGGTLDDFAIFLRDFRRGQTRIDALLAKSKQESTSLRAMNKYPDQRRKTFHGLSFQEKKRIYMCKWSNLTPYQPEEGLSREEINLRLRLGKRLSTMNFPLDACMQALKCKGTKDLDGVCELLLHWFPKGSGSRTRIYNLAKIIQNSERKLSEVASAIKQTMARGNVVERYGELKKHFQKYDSGQKGFLSPSEFDKLTHCMGVYLSHAELGESIAQLDEDENGRIEFHEYLSWWGDEEITKYFQTTVLTEDIENAHIGDENEKVSRKTKEENMKCTNVLPSLPLKPVKLRAGDFYSMAKSHLAKSKQRENITTRIGWAIDRYNKLTTIPITHLHQSRSMCLVLDSKHIQPNTILDESLK